MAMAALLEARQLCKRYSRGEREFPAVDGVSLSVRSGDFISIIGRSGSGKSTLLNMLAGLLAPSSGSVLLEGADICALSDRKKSEIRNSRLGYIPQGADALRNLTVFDNVRLPYYLSKRHGDACGRASFLIDAVGISPLADLFPSQLSGGELRRALIARALMNEPDILMAVEPTSDLDIETSREIMSLFSRVSKNGAAVLIVTHDLDALAFGNKVFTMAAGRLSEGMRLGALAPGSNPAGQPL
jgi:putative ABC transport system ATP-binding protein